MRVAIFGTDDARARFGQRLAQAGHDVVQVEPADLASAASIEVVVLVTGDERDGQPPPRITVGELTRGTSARVVRLARAFEEAGIHAEVSLDIHAAMARLRDGQEGSAGRDLSPA